jgi:predicted lysophospholipase L1 biosynthesis ABC-type transport system permease subunit
VRLGARLEARVVGVSDGADDGKVALLVGAIGVANIMVISVLERRSEIGLRRALGATRGHIGAQFLAEAVLLALIGGAAGVAVGAAAVAAYTYLKGEATVIPAEAWAGGLAAIVIGAIAGLLPALRAARVDYSRNGMSILVLLLYSGYAVGKVAVRFRSSTVPL